MTTQMLLTCITIYARGALSWSIIGKHTHDGIATLFGMCETDAYLAFRYFHPLALNLSHREFTECLSLQLLTYKSSFHDTGPSSRLRKHMPVAPTARPLQTVVAKIMSSHTLKTNTRVSSVSIQTSETAAG